MTVRLNAKSSIGGALGGQGAGVAVDAPNADVTVTGAEMAGGFEAAAVSHARLSGVHASGPSILRRGSLVIDHSRLDTAFSALIVMPGGGSARATVRDSVLTGVNTSPFQAASTLGVVEILAGGTGADFAIVTLVGSTVYATGARFHAALLARRFNDDPGDAEAHLLNTVLRREGADGSTTADIAASTSGGPGGTLSIDASHSAWTTANITGDSTAPAPGSGTNVAGDPLFAAAPSGTILGADFRLQTGSPLVDRGDSATVLAGELDAAGAARSLDGNGDCSAVPDIGAYERPAEACPPPAVPGGPAGPAADTLRPVLSKLRISAGRASFVLSEAARVTLVVERAKPGWRSGTRCLAGRRRGKACTRWVRVRTLSVSAKAGLSTASLGRLTTGKHRVRATALDAARNAAVPVRAAFTVRGRKT